MKKSMFIALDALLFALALPWIFLFFTSMGVLEVATRAGRWLDRRRNAP